MSCVYSRLVAAHPWERFQLGKGACLSLRASFLGCVLAVVLFARRRGLLYPVALVDLTFSPVRFGIFSPSPCHQRRAVGGDRSDVRGHGVSERRANAASIRAISMRRRLEGPGIVFTVLALFYPRGRAQSGPGSSSCAFALGKALRARSSKHFREPDIQSASCLVGGLTMGTLLSLPLSSPARVESRSPCARTRAA